MSGAEPFLIAAAIASATSATVSGVNSYQMSRYQAQTMENQAKAARADAGIAAQLALEDGDRTIGRGIALAGASGAGLGGSARAVLEDLGRQSLYEARRVSHEGDAWARAAEAEAKATRMQGNVALATSLLDAGASILGGVMDAKSRARMRKPAAPSGSLTVDPIANNQPPLPRRRVGLGAYGPW